MARVASMSRATMVKVPIATAVVSSHARRTIIAPRTSVMVAMNHVLKSKRFIICCPVGSL